jgi:hypothetical protein
MDKKIIWMDEVAIRKAATPGWVPCIYESVTGGVLVSGGIPGVYTRGPRKGKPKWEGNSLTRVIVTDAEIEAERTAYSQRTGNCWRCQGAGQELVGWSRVEGQLCKPCRLCNQTGKALGPYLGGVGTR